MVKMISSIGVVVESPENVDVLVVAHKEGADGYETSCNKGRITALNLATNVTVDTIQDIPERHIRKMVATDAIKAIAQAAGMQAVFGIAEVKL